jgi:hypothetical protein
VGRDANGVVADIFRLVAHQRGLDVYEPRLIAVMIHDPTYIRSSDR